jgi:hypothetical protein
LVGQKYRSLHGYDNPQFWSDPGNIDITIVQVSNVNVGGGDTQCSLCITTEKTKRIPDEFEMYNLSDDPLETKNLADPRYATPETKNIQESGLFIALSPP